MKKRIPRGVKKQLINVLVLLLLMGLTLYAVAQSNSELSFTNIKNFISGCKPAYIAAAFIALFLSVAFEGFSLHLITAKLGHKRPLASSMVYATSDVYFSAITPSATGGQPASAFYMIKDGIDGGTATFALVFNLVAYTAAILVVAVFAFAFGGGMFAGFSVLSKVLILLGVCLQTLLLTFFILCMRANEAVIKIGNKLIKFLTRIKIIKKPEKWSAKLLSTVEKYRAGYENIRRNKLLFAEALALNVGQRVSQALIACFVCLAAAPQTSFLQLFAMQAFVQVGYNSIPLPGGVGAYEYLHLNIYGQLFDAAFASSSMMVARSISYYLRFILSGIYTLGYHLTVTRKNSAKTQNEENDLSEGSPDENTNEKRK